MARITLLYRHNGYPVRYRLHREGEVYYFRERLPEEGYKYLVQCNPYYRILPRRPACNSSEVKRVFPVGDTLYPEYRERLRRVVIPCMVSVRAFRCKLSGIYLPLKDNLGRCRYLQINSLARHQLQGLLPV